MFIYRLQKILNLVRFCLQSTDEIQVKTFFHLRSALLNQLTF